MIASVARPLPIDVPLTMKLLLLPVLPAPVVLDCMLSVVSVVVVLGGGAVCEALPVVVLLAMNAPEAVLTATVVVGQVERLLPVVVEVGS